MPRDAPVVARQSLMPARARGTPTAKDQASHMMAGGEKPTPLPSEADPCVMGKPVSGSSTTCVPLSRVVMSCRLSKG